MPRARRPRRRRRPAPKLYTIGEAARRLGFAYNTFRRHVLPTLGAQRLGRRWIITAAMLTRFLEALAASRRDTGK